MIAFLSGLVLGAACAIGGLMLYARMVGEGR